MVKEDIGGYYFFVRGGQIIDDTGSKLTLPMLDPTKNYWSQSGIFQPSCLIFHRPCPPSSPNSRLLRHLCMSFTIFLKKRIYIFYNLNVKTHLANSHFPSETIKAPVILKTKSRSFKLNLILELNVQHAYCLSF